MSNRNPCFPTDRKAGAPSHAKKTKLPMWKKSYIKIAKDLCYPARTIKALEQAKDDRQADAIMTQAREDAAAKEMGKK